MCSIGDNVVRPDVVGAFRHETDARSIIEPDPPALARFAGYLQPLTSSDTFNLLVVDRDYHVIVKDNAAEEYINVEVGGLPVNGIEEDDFTECNLGNLRLRKADYVVGVRVNHLSGR